MAKSKAFLKKIQATKILLLILATLFITFFSPREGKFKYEYQKGKPWPHQVLVAPFDFPVYKSEFDLKKEKDSILRNFSLYFNYNQKINIDQKARFRNYFYSYWKRNNPRNSKPLPDSDYEQIQLNILQLIDAVYKKGIIELPEELTSLSRKDASIIEVRNNVADETTLAELYTPRKAYAHITHELDVYSDWLSTAQSTNYDNFFKNIAIESFIEPNLFYDENTSNSMKEGKLKEISLTEGMVLSGERIILPGDMISLRTFQILESLRIEYENRMGKSTDYYIVLAGQALLIFLLLFLLYYFIRRFRKEIFYSTKSIGFILLIISIMCLAGSLTIKYNPESLYFVPFAIIGIILKTFFESKVALIANIITVIIVGLWAPSSYEFVLLNIVAGLVGVLSLTNVYRRGRLFITSAWITASYMFVYFAISIYQEAGKGIENIETAKLLLFAGNGLLVLASIPLIYAFEKLFKFLSDATLLEISDTNQPLLRKLAERAPGTFQHSLQVANLSEEAIFKIGGNPLLMRAGALYHDIGKMEHPIFFIENLSDGISPHAKLDFEQSVEVIVGHVTKGIEIGRKYKIPEPVLDFIRTHHGTVTVHYFYRSFIKQNPGIEVDINKFSYPGPKPFSREMAVLMMADSVEAASRSLKNYTENDLNSLVENIINSQMKEGQFNDTNITLREIETIKSIFKRRLRNIYHGRIEYPTLS